MGVNFFKTIQKTLSEHLDWNKARRDCMTSLIQGIMHTRNVNLSVIAACDELEDNSDAKESSKYRRFQRFFAHFDMPLDDVSRLIRNKLPVPDGGYILSMDRTNWKFGKKHINILTIGINVGNVCVPLIWKVLPQSTKNGNSSSKHRQWLISRMLDILPAKEICALLMDREFCGSEWLQWLDEQGVGYVLRIKSNTIVGDRLAHEYKRKPTGKQDIWGAQLYFGGKVEKGKRIYVVSNRFGGKEALELYRRRWGIEQLFGHLKKRGFDFEETHMTDKKKIERLMALVSVSFLFSYGWGKHLRTLEKQSVFLKRKSDYRYGLASLMNMATRPNKYKELIDEFYIWLRGEALTEAH